MVLASGTDACVLSLPGVFGPDGPQHLGLNRALASARDGKPVKLFGPGTEKRNYVSAEEVADVVAFVLSSGPVAVAYVGGEINDIRTYLEQTAQVFGVSMESAPGDRGGDALVERDDRLPPPREFADEIASFVARSTA
jgi:nucleoside-diphosphate-sugar epimerase